MALIKECRELARLTKQANGLRQKSSAALQKKESPGRSNNLMRSMDSLDELEESDLEGSKGSILSGSPRSASTPSVSDDEEQKKVEKHDLDKSCDSYGVRIEKSSESEISDGIPEPVDNAGPRKR